MKSATKKQYSWTNILQFYGEQNKGRKTRLGVFENGNDYWLENGLSLKGIDFEEKNGKLSAQIMLDDQMTHSIESVKKVSINFSLDKMNDGLDITDLEGQTTILRFEDSI
jgi:hypothetical protein